MLRYYAVILLMQPSSSPAFVPEKDFEGIAKEVKSLAIEWEIMDPREQNYMLARPDDFVADMRTLRFRREDLADAPLIANSHRFPSRDAICDWLQFNRKYRNHLESRADLERDRVEILRRAIGECDELYRLWDCVRDAKCDFYYVYVRRQAMKRLRDLVGEENYDSFDLPPPFPVWQFNTLR